MAFGFRAFCRWKPLVVPFTQSFLSSLQDLKFLIAITRWPNWLDWDRMLVSASIVVSRPTYFGIVFKHSIERLLCRNQSLEGDQIVVNPGFSLTHFHHQFACVRNLFKQKVGIYCSGQKNVIFGYPAFDQS